MSFDPGLQLGEIITNDKLRKVFQCGNMGGMRRSLKTNTLVLISDHTKELYEDKWIGDVLHYTGMGRKGDQDINASQNKTLKESNANGVDVHLFEVFQSNNYIYMGQVELVEKPYQEKQKDEDGLLRNVWIFPVRPIEINNTRVAIEANILKESYKKKERQAKRLTDEELSEKAKECQSIKTSSRLITSKTYIRNAFIAEYVKRRANGICQLCNKKAPFKNKSGEPYLETHHIRWLSEGGPDTIANTVALCPNCHRKMHVVDSKRDKRKLIEAAKGRFS